MQKLLRRTAFAKRQAIRKAENVKGAEASDRRITRASNETAINEIKRDRRLGARHGRREDWVSGPLAPKRNVGKDAATYGALDVASYHGPEKANWKDYGLRYKDRVVFIQKGHRDYGKIGTITQVTKESEEAIVEGINKVSFST
jgi:large subunit ribosomal protein L24